MAGSDETGQPETNGPVSNKGDKDAWPTETVTRFHYDALDSLIGRTKSAEKEQRFYRNDELANEVCGSVSTTFVRAEGVVLAEHQTGGDLGPMLLVGDDKNSVLSELTQQGLNSIAYSPYGHRTDEALASSHLGYNGERRERQTGWYLLGNGYRVFNPRLMRFHSPDNLSPFGKGGVNAYMYCVGDPVNSVDPTGHFGVLRFLGLFRKTSASSSSKHLSDIFLINTKNKPAVLKKLSVEDFDNLENKMANSARTAGKLQDQLHSLKSGTQLNETEKVVGDIREDLDFYTKEVFKLNEVHQRVLEEKLIGKRVITRESKLELKGYADRFNVRKNEQGKIDLIRKNGVTRR